MKKSIRFGVVFALIVMLLGVGQAYAALPQERIDAAETYIQKMIEECKIPGMSAVIVSDGQVVFARGFGHADAEGTQPVDVNTDFQIASVSKNMTALAIMQLKEQGKLSVDDLVTQYIPWFASKDKNNSDKITIKNLLQHTSGFPTRAYGLQIKDSTPDQLEDQIQRLSKTNLTGQPGARHQYSNPNYWTLALIVEKVSGMKFADYMEQNIFGPLGMERSGYYNKLAGSENIALGHRVEQAKQVPFDYTVPGTTISAGGVYSNATDMGKYITVLLNKGTYNGVTILKPETVEEMYTNGTPLDRDIEYGYGLYVMKMEDGLKIVQHGGDNPNFTAHLYLVPDENFGFAVMANTQNIATHRIATNLSRLLLGGEPRLFETRLEASEGLTNILNSARMAVFAIIALWTLIVLIGLQTRRYVIFKGQPALARFVLQVILFPLVIFVAAFICYLLPIMQIGSMDVAMLYQPDTVKAILGLALALVLLGGTCILFGFVTKAKRVVIRAGEMQ